MNITIYLCTSSNLATNENRNKGDDLDSNYEPDTQEVWEEYHHMQDNDTVNNEEGESLDISVEIRNATDPKGQTNCLNFSRPVVC